MNQCKRKEKQQQGAISWLLLTGRMKSIQRLFFIFCLHHFFHSKHLVLPSHLSCWLERCQWCRWSRSPPRSPSRERANHRATPSPVRTPWCPTSVSRLLRFTRTQRTRRWSAPPLRVRTPTDQLQQVSPLRPGRGSLCPRVQSHKSQRLIPRSSTRSLISSRSHRHYLPRTRSSHQFPSLCPSSSSRSKSSRLSPSLSLQSALRSTARLCVSRCLSSSLNPRLLVSPK